MSTNFTNRFWNETPDAIISISPDGKVLHWNPGAEVIFGYAREEAVGSLLIELIVPPGQAEDERRIQAEALLQDVAVYESVRQRKDGALVHVSVKAASPWKASPARGARSP